MDWNLMMTKQQSRFFIPFGAGLLGMIFLSALYLGIVSWAESPEHALDLFWEDRWLVIPILLGFGIQSALYSILKFRLFIPDLSTTGPSGPVMGVGGTTSTIAMAACCVHHVADVLPVLGLTAAAAFLAEFQTTFMVVGLGINLIGIGVMIKLIIRGRKGALRPTTQPRILAEEA
jgi:hypothetical protein